MAINWRQSNNIAVGAVAVIVISLGMILYQGFSCSQNSNSSPAGNLFPGWCTECDTGVGVAIDTQAEDAYTFPMECPNCLEMSVFPAIYCQQCDGLYGWDVPSLSGEEIAPESCALCGGEEAESRHIIDSEMEIQEYNLHERFPIGTPMGEDEYEDEPME
jgi:hypothetical protein